MRPLLATPADAPDTRLDMSVAPRRHVLVIHYHFPPLGGAGVQRVLKFVKYLPEFGWDVTVLTSSSRAYAVTDESLLADVPPEVRVVRTHRASNDRAEASAAEPGPSFADSRR